MKSEEFLFVMTGQAQRYRERFLNGIHLWGTMRTSQQWTENISLRTIVYLVFKLSLVLILKFNNFLKT